MSATGSRLTVSDSRSPALTAATMSAVWFLRSLTEISLVTLCTVAEVATLVLRRSVAGGWLPLQSPARTPAQRSASGRPRRKRKLVAGVERQLRGWPRVTGEASAHASLAGWPMRRSLCAGSSQLRTLTRCTRLHRARPSWAVVRWADAADRDRGGCWWPRCSSRASGGRSTSMSSTIPTPACWSTLASRSCVRSWRTSIPA